ncbi:Uncharacterised protein [Vibrio cholerae]|nr:Uncharacterised protein [Vibrio cholerae]
MTQLIQYQNNLCVRCTTPHPHLVLQTVMSP